MRWQEWSRMAVAVVLALVLGAGAHELYRGPLSHAADPVDAEVLGEVLEVEPDGAGFALAERRASEAVLSVEVDACGGRRRASATLVEGNGGSPRLVTNVHVVRGATAVQLSDEADGTRRGGARPDGRWPGRDLAQLDGDGVDSLGDRALPVGPDPEVGDRVVVVGHPEGRRSVEVGTVRSVELRSTEGVTSPAVVVDVGASGGHSGGAVVDRAGRLVGIVAARDPRTGDTVAHPVSALGTARVDLPSTC